MNQPSSRRHAVSLHILLLAVGLGTVSATARADILDVPADFGTYAGDDTDCGVAECPDPCPEDVDGSGGIDFGDILRILANWGPCV